jgi:hypothetical protein
LALSKRMDAAPEGTMHLPFRTRTRRNGLFRSASYINSPGTLHVVFLFVRLPHCYWHERDNKTKAFCIQIVDNAEKQRAPIRELSAA